jgi:hypothetical protein
MNAAFDKTTMAQRAQAEAMNTAFDKKTMAKRAQAGVTQNGAFQGFGHGFLSSISGSISGNPGFVAGTLIGEGLKKGVEHSVAQARELNSAEPRPLQVKIQTQPLRRH